MPREWLPRQLLLFGDLHAERDTPLLADLLGALPEESAHAGNESVADALGRALEHCTTRHRVVINYTSNRRVLLSSREGSDGTVQLRAHQAFRSAPDEIADAALRLYLFAADRTEQRQLARTIMRWHRATAAPPRSLDNETLTHGLHHDLRATLERVNREHFEGALALDITFGNRVARTVMGRHEKREPRSLILINPVLDHPWIAAWYLDFLVFHECLHEVIPPRLEGLRAELHPQEFRAREDAHPDAARAREFEAWVLGPGWRRLSAAARAWLRSKRNGPPGKP